MDLVTVSFILFSINIIAAVYIFNQFKSQKQNQLVISNNKTFDYLVNQKESKVLLNVKNVSLTREEIGKLVTLLQELKKELEPVAKDNEQF